MLPDFVTTYLQPNYQGNGTLFNAGTFRPYDKDRFIRSIEVPDGFVAQLWEHVDVEDPWGISADFLESHPNLEELGFPQVSYISVFSSEKPGGLVWRRGTLKQDGGYEPGHWGRRLVQEPPPNHTVTVAPPTRPRFGSIVVRAGGDRAADATMFDVFLSGPDSPRLSHPPERFDSSLTCRFSDLRVGKYWITPDNKADYPWPITPPRTEVDCVPSQQADVVFLFGGSSGPEVRDHRQPAPEVRDHRH